MAARFRAARAGREEAVLEGFHALKHALRFGADVRLVAAADPEALERLATALAPDLAGAFRSRAQLVDRAVLAQLAPRTPRDARRRDRPPAGGGRGRRAGRHRRPGRAARGSAPPRERRRRRARRRGGGSGGRGDHGRAGSVGSRRTARVGGPALRAAGRRRADGAARLAALPAGRPLVALDPGGERLRPGAIPPGAVLAFGTERHGLSDAVLARATARLAIPMRPGVSSLNLATAVAVVLYAAAAPAP